MAEERPLIEEVLDYVVYAPVGIAVQIAKALPDLVESGRKRVGSTLSMARVLGEFSVGGTRRKIEHLFDNHGAETAPQASPAKTIDVGVTERNEPAVTFDEATLAIPGYDSLAASQVVARLAGLTDTERTQVKAYEAAKRARRTILARITQLDEERNVG
jgi:hypothetical protein